LKDLCDIWRVHGTVFHQHFISWIELSVEMASIQVSDCDFSRIIRRYSQS
jgi:hypothetical protein